MFERYTEKARRVIFFARYEASQFGSATINTEHMLLGLLREDKPLAQRIFPSQNPPYEAVRGQIAQGSTPGEKIATSVDLPLSNESKRVLAYAGQEVERLKHHFLGTEHLFLGLLREKAGLAAEILAPLHIDAEVFRSKIAEPSTNPEERDFGPSLVKFYGKYRGVVVDTADPEQLGRVRATVPAISKSPLSWAIPCTPYPASGAPVLAVPPLGASVWIEFEGGDSKYPIWSGCFWSVGQPPLLKLP